MRMCVEFQDEILLRGKECEILLRGKECETLENPNF